MVPFCKYKVMHGPQPCDRGKYIHEKFGHWSFLWSIVASSLREWGWGKVMSSKTMGYELSKPNDSWLNSSPAASWYIKCVILRYEWRKT